MKKFQIIISLSVFISFIGANLDPSSTFAYVQLGKLRIPISFKEIKLYFTPTESTPLRKITNIIGITKDTSGPKVCPSTKQPNEWSMNFSKEMLNTYIREYAFGQSYEGYTLRDAELKLKEENAFSLKVDLQNEIESS